MAKMGGLAHVGLFISDVEKSRDFYNDILEFETIWETELEDEGGVTKIAFVRNGNLTLELVQPCGGPNSGDGVVDHIAMAVEDIEAIRKNLEKKGIEFEQEETVFSDRVFENGAKWLLFRGPDNEHLEITEVMK